MVAVDEGPAKTQGIYILGNDHVIEDTLAFLYSLKRYAPDYPVRLIPYNDSYQKLARVVCDRFAVELFEDRSLFAELEQRAQAIRGQKTPAARKFACWFGPFDEFIYFDTDVIVFQDQKDVFDLLARYDIVYCGSGRTLGIKEVFTNRVLERNLFSDREIDDLFNTGFFASKKGVLDYGQLIALLQEAVTVSDIFVPHLQDQPLINYVMLKAIPRRANLREMASPVTADIWAGVPTLSVRDGKLYKSDGEPVRHIHWAGQKPIARRSYVDLWLKYRYPGLKGITPRFVTGFKFWLWRYHRLFNKVVERRLHRSNLIEG